MFYHTLLSIKLNISDIAKKIEIDLRFLLKIRFIYLI